MTEPAWLSPFFIGFFIGVVTGIAIFLVGAYFYIHDQMKHFDRMHP